MEFSSLGWFSLGVFLGVFGTVMLCLLCHREKPDRGIRVEMDNVDRDHTIHVTFRKKGGRNGHS